VIKRGEEFLVEAFSALEAEKKIKQTLPKKAKNETYADGDTGKSQPVFKVEKPH